MTGCTVAHRNSVRRAANRCGHHPAVVATDVLAPDTDPTGAWTLEIVVEGDRAPGALLNKLYRCDCDVLDVATRGEPAHTTVVAAATRP